MYGRNLKSSVTNSFLQKENLELSSIDAAPEFHDPYSDLSLFLAKKIKQVMCHTGFRQKWSLKIQEDLIAEIKPEFQKQFPKYRLGVFALRKIWEKIAYYSMQIQEEKEAIGQDGKLNIHFFIRKHLQQLFPFKGHTDLPPYHIAHQIAVKLSECIATIDAVRPNLDQLTRMIWVIQRQLLPGQVKSPYDEYNAIDKLIVKTILEIRARQPQSGQQELEYAVRENLQSLNELPNFSSCEKMTDTIAAMLAGKLYDSSYSYLREEKEAIANFIRRHTTLCKHASPSSLLSESVRRILALYMLASRLPKNISQEVIQEAVLATYPVMQKERPLLPQSVYAFIAATILLLPKEKFCYSPQYVAEKIRESYLQTLHLPAFEEEKKDLIEIIAWKVVSEKEGLLEQLPYRTGQKIEEEMANVLIDQPKSSFSGVVKLTCQFFQRAKELGESKKWNDIERKIHLWTLQGDLLCRFTKFNSDSPLFQMAKERFKEENNPQELANELPFSYVKQFPELAPYFAQIHIRAQILCKYLWYTEPSYDKESSLQRFLKWHKSFFPKNLSENQRTSALQNLCKRMVPLVPTALCKEDQVNSEQ